MAEKNIESYTASMDRWLTRLVSVLLIVALVIAVFGVFAASFGPMDHEGMTVCALMHLDVVCAMDPLEHIALWQATLASVVPQFSLTLALLAIVALASVSARLILKLAQPALRYVRIPLPQRVSVERPLQDAFSNGILNPKLF